MGPFPDEVHSAQTIIIMGPPMTGEARLFHSILATRGAQRLVISAGQTAETFRTAHHDIAGDTGTVRIVDCLSAGQEDTPPDDEHTRYVDGPGNLTAIGVKITEFLEAVKEGPDQVVVGVNSLSELLMHSGLDQSYQFIHILAQQTAAADIPLIATMNAQGHDEQTVNAMQSRFECFVETRTTESTNEYRVRTKTNEPTAWKTLSHD